MHQIEPYFRWRDEYIASEDEKSPFFGQQYSESAYSHRLYNFYLHPQWDAFGSTTLYGKILHVDYDEGYTLIELIGEWNDTLHNDIHFLKRNITDHLYDQGIVKFVFFCDNVLNFHATFEDDYYAEWAEEVTGEGGWILLVNTRQHFEEELLTAGLQQYLHFGTAYNGLNWRTAKAQFTFAMLEELVDGRVKHL